MGGIELQLLCGVRIELAVGPLPSPIPDSLELQLLGRRGFNPSWARGCIPNKGKPITGSQNPGLTRLNQTNPLRMFIWVQTLLDFTTIFHNFFHDILHKLISITSNSPLKLQCLRLELYV